MKKFNNIMKALIVGGIIISSGMAKAEDMCTPQPSCESLGFTKTATICEGQDTLKCPFNTNKVYCYKKSDTIVKYELFDTLRINNINIGEIIYLNTGNFSGRVMTMGGENFTTEAGQPEASAEYCRKLKRAGLDWRLMNNEDLEYIVNMKSTVACGSAEKSSLSSDIYYCTRASISQLSNSSYDPCKRKTFHYRNNYPVSNGKYNYSCQARCVADF